MLKFKILLDTTVYIGAGCDDAPYETECITKEAYPMS